VDAGCYLATANGELAPPVDCAIEFTGIKTDDSVVQAEFVFDAGEKSMRGVGLAAVPVKKFEFPRTGENA
jgi:hypothetical protein